MDLEDLNLRTRTQANGKRMRSQAFAQSSACERERERTGTYRFRSHVRTFAALVRWRRLFSMESSLGFRRGAERQAAAPGRTDRTGQTNVREIEQVCVSYWPARG